ncbi:hypothetical protein [Corynebacterium propinquum]|uniref:hypothetical protein n=1 Tax=Corynebacterium propinquum TaxID=43769 RepID=UPI00191F45E4|nr:hypothetical protein [Corynebacterium propinquum]QQU87341.1 hypothetical protein I6I70_01020 [Corynebacterium propinquum]
MSITNSTVISPTTKLIKLKRPRAEMISLSAKNIVPIVVFAAQYGIGVLVDSAINQMVDLAQALTHRTHRRLSQ